MFLKMLQEAKSQNLSGFLSSDFCRVAPTLADEMCKTAKVSPKAKPRDIRGATAETLYRTIQATKIMAPPTNCLAPIGEKAILSGLYKQIKGEFYTAVSRAPSVYRGNPFIIEAGLAFGKAPDNETKPEKPAQPLAPVREDAIFCSCVFNFSVGSFPPFSRLQASTTSSI
jgi:DNA topoisomerase VI subunit B